MSRLRVLFCVNWRVDRIVGRDTNRFSPDYVAVGEPYWFFRHGNYDVDVDVLDCRSFLNLDRAEEKWLHCYPSKGILGWLRSRQYDVIISHGAQVGIVIGLLQSLSPRRFRTPHVMFDVGSISGGSAGWKNPLVISGCRFAVDSLAAVICHSSSQLEFYRSVYPNLTKIANFIPLGVDTDEFRPEPRKVEDEILCIGYSKMNIELLIKAYSALNTKTRLVILGVPEGKEVHQPGVASVPKVSIEEMRQMIRRARFAVLPLPFVDYPIGQQRFLQSMALGKTVLASNIPAVRDYIRDGETGFLYEADHEQSLHKKLQYLLSEDDTVERVGRAARVATESEFSEAAMANQVVALLRNVAERSSGIRENILRHPKNAAGLQNSTSSGPQ